MAFAPQLDQRLTKYLEIVAAIFEKEEQIASHSKSECRWWLLAWCAAVAADEHCSQTAMKHPTAQCAA